MTIRLVPTIVCCDSHLHFLNLHHVPHLNTTIFLPAEFLFAQEGLVAGRDLRKMLNIILHCIHEIHSLIPKTIAA